MGIVEFESSRAVLEAYFGPGAEPQVARAPGRVNLIGEHTDYNGGYVLPFAIDRWTEVALRPRRDSRVLMFSEAFREKAEFDLPLRAPVPTGSWEDYLKGILLELSRHANLPFGFEGAIVGNVPIGAGLSSSASLEVALALSLSRLYEIELRDLPLIKLCQRAETEFVGTSCGIMDQYVALLGREGAALLLDTLTLRHHYVPLTLGGKAFLVIDSGIRRSLSQSGYNERRRECEEALRWLQNGLPNRPFSSLRHIGHEELRSLAGAMPKRLWQRALHVVMENERVLRAVAALGRGDDLEVGRLLFESHASLRDLFQVSTPELDFLVEWGIGHGALGARLVGGGFGGVTLHLVPAEAKVDYGEGISRAYEERFGRKASVLEVRPGAGAKALSPWSLCDK